MFNVAELKQNWIQIETWKIPLYFERNDHRLTAVSGEHRSNSAGCNETRQGRSLFSVRPSSPTRPTTFQPSAHPFSYSEQMSVTRLENRRPIKRPSRLPCSRCNSINVVPPSLLSLSLAFNRAHLSVAHRFAQLQGRWHASDSAFRSGTKAPQARPLEAVVGLVEASFRPTSQDHVQFVSRLRSEPVIKLSTFINTRPDEP